MEERSTTQGYYRSPLAPFAATHATATFWTKKGCKNNFFPMVETPPVARYLMREPLLWSAQRSTTTERRAETSCGRGPWLSPPPSMQVRHWAEPFTAVTSPAPTARFIATLRSEEASVGHYLMTSLVMLVVQGLVGRSTRDHRFSASVRLPEMKPSRVRAARFLNRRSVAEPVLAKRLFTAQSSPIMIAGVVDGSLT